MRVRYLLVAAYVFFLAVPLAALLDGDLRGAWEGLGTPGALLGGWWLHAWAEKRGETR